MSSERRKLDKREMIRAREAVERGAAAMARFLGRNNAKRAKAATERIRQDRRREVDGEG